MNKKTSFPERAGEMRRLRQDFADYYARHRCRWAPANPRRLFNAAFKGVYSVYHRRLTPCQFLALVYDRLGARAGGLRGLLQTFDPAKYGGRLPLEEHFLNLFLRRLKGRVRNCLTRTRTDQGRPGDRSKFRPRP